MKHLNVPFLSGAAPEAQSVPQTLDANGVAWHEVGCNNWQADYPYTPRAQFRIACTSEAFLLQYRADESTVRAQFGDDNGNVWTDSCMEFFLAPDPASETYYNLECNCIGTVLLGTRGGDVKKEHAAVESLRQVDRWSSLGRVPFGERPASEPWTVALVVPFGVYWHHDIAQSLKSGRLTMRANFYKCGDDLPQPHFLSWSPIDNDKPNFHLPQFFGEIEVAAPGSTPTTNNNDKQ